MAEETAIVAGLSLPPKVVGKVNGHLVMKVDEVLWSRKPPGEVSAVVLWWGGSEPTTFRPCDVSEDSSKRRNAGVIYEIRTSLELFEKYLRKCGGLEIAIADKYGMPIGCVTVMDIWQMITNSPFQGYYPIVNNFGNRIGDLHVSFNLRMQSSIENGNLTVLKAPNKKVCKTKDFKRLSSLRDKQPVCHSKTKDEKTKKNEKVLKDTQVSDRVLPDSSTHCDSTSGCSDEDVVDVENRVISEKRVSPTSNIISQILKHGTRLRNAMTASVMDDAVHIDFKNVPDISGLSPLSETTGCLQLKPDCPPPAGEKATYHGKTSSCNDAGPAVSRKVMDYLSGKPMSDQEENEALAAIRNMTPTKDMLGTLPNTQTKFKLNKSAQPSTVESQESSEVVTNITDYCVNHNFDCDNQCSFDIDAQLLSHINCLRVTIVNLVLNSVGMKRIGSYPKKKSSTSQSTVSLQPPGVTYFVEYKFPLTAGNRPWEANVRYCSKRFSDHEVLFGDRTVHNLPASWQNSRSEELNWTSLISSLSFKVCARHLHQRVPIVLGLASPDSAEQLIKSTHLRQNFDLPVIDTNRLPVAQLQVCLELGRDRIHFGGLLDPENNSLGMKSPRASSVCKGQPSQTKNKTGKSVTTVTRNISAKSCTAPKIPLHQANQADRLIKKLVNNANFALKSSESSETSSLSSTGKTYLKPTNSHVPLKNNQISSYMIGCLPNGSRQTYDQLIKHELALTIQQVIEANVLTKFTSKQQYFYVTYKFPVMNVLKKGTIDWHSCSTEPSKNGDGSWVHPQNHIHSVVIPQKELFYDFLRQTFKYQGESTCITFSLCIRCSNDKRQDFLVAEASLPLSCLSNLEEAYKEAARNKQNFSSSSCSTIVLDLPFESLFTKDQEDSGKSGCLRIKVDYRHSMVQQSLHKSYPPGSRGDSVSQNMAYTNFEETTSTGDMCHSKFRKSSDGDLDLGRIPLSVPSWARTEDKRPMSPYNTGDGLQYKEVPNFNHRPNVPSRNVHATWEHNSCSETQESAYMLKSFQNRGEVQSSIIDVINENKKYDPLNEQNNYPNTSYLRTESRSSHDVQLNASHSKEHSVNTQTENHLSTKIEAETSSAHTTNKRHMSSRGTSPIQLLSPTVEKVKCEVVSTEAKPEQQDKAQQVLIDTVHQESQTTQQDKENLKETFFKSLDKIPPAAGDSVLSCSGDDKVETIEVDSEPQLTKKFTPMDHSTQEIEQLQNLSSHSVANSSISKTFRAKVGVECALHLQSTTGPLSSQGPDTQSFVFVSLNPCGVDDSISTSMHQNPLSVSPAVINNGEPEWHWEKEVVLPLDLLVSTMKRLIFSVWENDSILSELDLKDMKSSNLIGFSTLDLTVLSAGLPLICGWYNVMDFSGTCRGQIKLSAEPLEKISEIVDFPVLSSEGNSLPSTSVHSMFVAHCAYPEFPSHITQFPDMHVQKVAPNAANQIVSTTLGTYELLIKKKEKVQLPCANTGLDNHIKKIRTSTAVPLRRKVATTSFSQSAEEECNSNPFSNSTVRTSSPCNQAKESNSGEIVDKDPSALLREKLSELDKITKNIKARLICHVQATQSTSPCLKFDSQSTSENKLQTDVYKKNSPKCDTSACSSIEKGLLGGSEGCSTVLNNGRELQPNFELSGACSNLVGNEGNNMSQKQRKLWKRQEDLIDFGNLCPDSEGDEESMSQNEELGEWLTESALQHVFNPYLFNDILNSMNSSRGVTVVEIDDTDTSEGSPATTSHENDNNEKVQIESNVPETTHTHKNKRGDETFRKEASEIQRNERYTIRQTNRSGLSAGDADSGVDVDLSSNFNFGVFYPAATAYHDRFLPHHAGSQITSLDTEREGSSSCSSRYRQSTIPSSLSATPSDSPIHTNQSRGLFSQAISSSHVSNTMNTAQSNEYSRKS